MDRATRPIPIAFRSRTATTGRTVPWRCCAQSRRRAGPPTGRPTAYANVETHWWDASQIYGSSLKRQTQIRTDPATGSVRPDGKIHLDERGLLPIDDTSKLSGVELAGANGNWWIGLSIMHTVFAREHNAIVDRLRIDHPDKPGEWLFQKARLVIAALIAKIHTVEWTPALMNSPDGRLAMRGNFYGLLGEEFKNAYGRVGEGEILPGSRGLPRSIMPRPTR